MHVSEAITGVKTEWERERVAIEDRLVLDLIQELCQVATSLRDLDVRTGLTTSQLLLVDQLCWARRRLISNGTRITDEIAQMLERERGVQHAEKFNAASAQLKAILEGLRLGEAIHAE